MRLSGPGYENEGESEMNDAVVDSDTGTSVKSASIMNDTCIDDEIDEIKQELQDHIDRIEEPRVWASSCTLTSAVNPGLALKDGDVTGLPLSIIDASKIRQYALAKTQDDGQMHYIGYELMPGQFELRNPAWEQHIQDMTARVAKSIGISDAVAKLEKLVLHGVGDNQLKIEYTYPNFKYGTSTK